MRTISRLAALAIGCLAIGVAVAAPASAAAKAKRLKPISGKLSKPGYTVIAMATNGAARTARAPKGRFSLRPPARAMTLHLRAPDGTYAGPIVLGSRKRGRRAIVGVMAGAKLGRIVVKGAKGYAKLARKPSKRLWKLIDAKRQARARKGVPLGAGNFGLVRSKPPKKAPAGDPDFDGVPNSLDVDDDGDLVLDDYDRSTAASTHRSGSRAATSATGSGGTYPDGSRLSVSPNLSEISGNVANADGGSTYEQIVASQATQGELGIQWIGIDPGSGELDCGRLTYCTTGGTGRLIPHPNTFEDFPECCDPDHDGLGALTQTENPSAGPDNGRMDLSPGVGGDQIGTGDVLILRGSVNGAPVESAKAVGFAFATPPVIASYDDGQGDAATFSLPQGQSSPIPVRAGPDGDIVLTLKVWRPQRWRTAGDPGSGEWIDMGNLDYLTVLMTDTGPQGIACPQSTISTADPNLIPTGTSPFPGYPGAGAFGDTRGDQPSDPANTLTYTVNLTQCLASQGAATGPGQGGQLKVLTLINDKQSHVATAGYVLFFRVAS